MAENTEDFCSTIAEILEFESGISTEYVTGIPWQERERLFDLGEIQILWLCGLPYVEKADLADSVIELLAVPVPSGSRYHGWPVYYSDVVVRRTSSFESFVDLRGTAFAYNEPRSHSGFNVVRAYLAELGQPEGFFGSVVESGAHARSIEMILSGVIESAAIDSTVLEWLQGRRADFGARAARHRNHRTEPDPALGNFKKTAGQFPFRDSPNVARSALECARAGGP